VFLHSETSSAGQAAVFNRQARSRRVGSQPLLQPHAEQLLCRIQEPLWCCRKPRGMRDRWLKPDIWWLMNTI